MHTPLFSPKSLQQHLESLPEPPESALLRAQEWKRMIDNRSVLAAKETELDGQFLAHFFRDILGFSDNRATGAWTLTKNQTSHADSSVPDGVLGFFAMQGSESVSRVYAVIELKDASHDLDKGQKRQNDKRTPVEQAFSYAPKAGGSCKWVIVSNYLELRLYHHSDQSKYERFELSRLTEPYELNRLLFLMHRDNLLPLAENRAASRTEELFAARVKEEDRITKEFYAEYKQARNDLFKHLCAANPSAPELLVLNKTQKLLDRVIFVCFVEDKEIIPRRTFRRLLDDVKRDKFNRSDTKIWDRVRGLFAAINEGYPEEHINKFNGGLFADDAELDALSIKDSVLEHIIALEKYDFDSDLNVNILGHIFEQSITDIEELKASIAGTAHDASKGKRKKDGVFYTPEYITRYIVQETIGGYLEERKAECGFEALPPITDTDWQSIKRDKRNVLTYNKTIERHIAAWTAYREKLAVVKVCDPACGSGAFLNQVFDFLYAEGQRVNAELARLQLGQTTTGDLQKDILQNNIYGVDVNPESVEITRLSLWLKTADRSKELTTLDHTIRCGNSLVDDPKVAGETAFDWAAAFPEVMQQGGFDVIVGNPPYGAQFGKTAEFVKKHYDTSESYLAFIYLCQKFIRRSGRFAYIVPTSWLSGVRFQQARAKLLSTFRLRQVITLPFNVFEEAYVDTCIFVCSMDVVPEYEINVYGYDKNDKITDFTAVEHKSSNYSVSCILNDKNLIIATNSSIYGLAQKFRGEQFVSLEQITSSTRGVEAGYPIIANITTSNIGLQPYFKGNIERYEYILEQSEWIDVSKHSESYIQQYFGSSKIWIRRLINRRDQLMSTIPPDNFIVKKDIYVFTITDVTITPHYLLALLNSKLLSYIYLNLSAISNKDDFRQTTLTEVRNLPIKVTHEQQPFIAHVRASHS